MNSIIHKSQMQIIENVVPQVEQINQITQWNVNLFNIYCQIQLNSEMENLSRMSSLCKDKLNTNSKLLSSYTSHTRCESVTKPAPKYPKKIQKLHTQMISSRKYNSTYKNAPYNYLSKQPTSPYRTSFSSTKGKRKKNSCNDNIKCQSSYNLKDCSMSRQMLNSSELFNSLYVEPMQMIYIMDKDNKQSLRSTQNRKKKTSGSTKNQVSTKRSTIQNQQLMDLYWKKSEQNLSRVFKRSKSKQTTVTKEIKKIKNQKRRKQSVVFTPTEQGSKIMLNSSDGMITPYEDILSRTFDILEKYEKKVKKLTEQKLVYQRMYKDSEQECENLRKSLRKKDNKYYQTQQNTVTKQKDVRGTRDTLKNSIQTFKR